MTRMNAKAEATLMAGDSLTSDVQGAQRAGMQAVWVNRSRKPRDNSIVPDYEISSLDELRPILASISDQDPD